MIKMAQLEDIRKMYFMEGLSIREISRRTGILPPDPVTPFDLDNRIKLEYYKLEKTFEGSIELEKKSGSWAPTSKKRLVEPQKN